MNKPQFSISMLTRQIFRRNRSIKSIAAGTLFFYCTLTMITVTTFWIISEITAAKNRTKQTQESFLQIKKDSLQRLVREEIKFIKYMQINAPLTMTRALKEQGDGAFSLFTLIYKQNSAIPDTILKENLHNYLPHTINNHLFFLRADGHLSFIDETAASDLIKSSIKKIIKENGTGLHILRSEEYEIFAIYIKKFEPLSMYIGTFFLNKELEADLQHKIITRYEEQRTEGNASFCIATLDGKLLTGNGETGDMADVKDSESRNAIEKIFETAKDGGGFVQYEITNPATGITEAKLAYADKISNWGWIISREVDIEEVNKFIKQSKKNLYRFITFRLTEVVGIFILLSLIFVFFANRMGLMLQKEFSFFHTFFKNSAQKSTLINRELLFFEDFAQLADVANQMTYERNNATMGMKKTLKENEILIREIHHRVKNNLQIIMGLLHLQSLATKNREARILFKESSDRIHSMGIVHEKLYQSDHFSDIDANDYFGTLVDELSRSYNINESGISIHKEVSAVPLNIDTAISLGLIINELVTNAIKHAFPHFSVGRIAIRFSVSDEKAELTISDNGKGMDTEKKNQNGIHLGMELVESLVLKLHGKLTISSEQGTDINIIFPYQ